MIPLFSFEREGRKGKRGGNASWVRTSCSVSSVETGRGAAAYKMVIQKNEANTAPMRPIKSSKKGMTCVGKKRSQCLEFVFS